METVSETLLRLADEIEQHPERWTTQHSARNREGDPVGVHSEEACAWCLFGLLMRFANSPFVNLLDTEIYARVRKVVGESLAEYNDAPGRTPQDIVATLREAAQ